MKPDAYIDGVPFAVPTAKKEAFNRHARKMAQLFKEHGAVEVVECWGGDVPESKVTSMSMAGRRKDDETVVFLGSYVALTRNARRWHGSFHGRSARPQGVAVRRQAPVFGGFRVLVDA